MSSVNLPKGRSLSGELSSTLSALVGLQPSITASQAQYAPINAQTQLATLQTLLMGAPASTYNTQEYSPAVYSTGGKYSYGKVPSGFTGISTYPELPQNGTGGGGGGGSGGGSNPTDPLGMTGGGFNPIDPLGLFGSSGPSKKLVTPGSYNTVTHTAPAQKGLLDIYSQDVAPHIINDVSTLGPQLNAALDTANPQSAAIIRQLNAQAQSELAAGSNLTPLEQQQMQQASRGAMAARGMNASNVSAADEILRQYQLGQQLLQQRQQFATGVVGTNQGFYGDALSRVLGLTSGSGTGATQGAASVGSGVGSQPFNLQSLMNSYTSDLYNTNLNMQASGAIANANNTNALIGAGIGAIGNIAGAI